MSGVVKITDLEFQMMERIDKQNLLEIDKVNRYIALVKQIRKLQIAINKSGVMVTTINASQEFLKANPAINELNKLTKTLIALENSIKFDRIEIPVKQKDDDSPQVSDLY